MERLGRHANGSVFFHNPPASHMMGGGAQVDRSATQGLSSRVGPVPNGLSRSKPVGRNWDDLLDRLAPAQRAPRRGLRAEAGTIPLPAHDPDKDLDSGRLGVAPLD
jgi:hypothetical protein